MMRLAAWHSRNLSLLRQGWASAVSLPSLAETKLTRQRSTSSLSSSSESSPPPSSSLRSNRGQDAVKLLPTYLADARSVETYSPSNPNGALQLGVAESQMLEDWLVPALNVDLDLSADSIYYQPTAGRASFRQAMASYIEDLLDLPSGRLDTEGLIVGAGCNAVLENLCFTLADAGDAVLIPTPYYAAFEFDLVARAGLAVEQVNTQDYQPKSKDLQDPTRYYPNRDALDAAYQSALDNGSPPRILLLSHPQNPLGICYPPHVIQQCIDWCRENEVHLISDEIYAGSVYRPELANFTSALKVANEADVGLGPYVHWVYALSKDFALSGLRVGVAYSENQDIRIPLQKLNDLCQISSQTQVWTETTLTRRLHNKDEQESWVHAFRKVNHERLNARCQALTAVLDECGIPYLPPTAGLFVWMDLSAYLPADGTDAERERSLYLKLVQDFGLLLTPGDSMRNEKPGFFRCVFTAASEEEFQLSLDRFRAFAQSSS